MHRLQRLSLIVALTAPLAFSQTPTTIPALPPVAQVAIAPASMALTQPVASITLPAGTRLMTLLRSPLHTTSAVAGSGVYLKTMYPVIVNDRIAIPEGTQVQGVVETERRPGRTHGRAQIRVHLTQLILPDNRIVPINAHLQSLVGSDKHRTVDAEGTLEPVDQIDRDVYTVAGGAGTGALIGGASLRGTNALAGAGILGGLGLAKVLFTRGNSISLRPGTQMEIVLSRAVTITDTAEVRAQ